MKNNVVISMLRDALEIKRSEMVEIFKNGDIEKTEDEVLEILMHKEEDESGECSSEMLEAFLNGFIIFKRGRQEPKPGQTEKPPLAIKSRKSVNNVVLKKLKIALSLSNEDIIDIFNVAEVEVSKNELTTYFRKEGHKHYKRCNDKHLINFFKGLEMMENE